MRLGVISIGHEQKKELKKYRDAIEDLDEAINWYPLNYAAYKMREEISAKLGQEVE